jgi:hypothetical protein
LRISGAIAERQRRLESSDLTAESRCNFHIYVCRIAHSGDLTKFIRRFGDLNLPQPIKARIGCVRHQAALKQRGHANLAGTRFGSTEPF